MSGTTGVGDVWEGELLACEHKRWTRLRATLPDGMLSVLYGLLLMACSALVVRLVTQCEAHSLAVSWSGDKQLSEKTRT